MNAYARENGALLHSSNTTRYTWSYQNLFLSEIEGVACETSAPLPESSLPQAHCYNKK